jgi:glycosyltransferase involved in cell wall biosynthesis
VKVALVTTPPSVRSGIGDYTRHLLPYLREHCEVQVFVPHGHDEPGWGDEPARPVARLNPREFDQILYQLGNEQAHAFMPRMIRALGGTVAQHDWVLFDMAMCAWPGLVRGGAKGHALALREGGLRETQVYLRNWLERRRQRSRPAPPQETDGLEGTLLFGWHGPEKGCRWTADVAGLRIPAEQVELVSLDVHLDPGRSLRVLGGDGPITPSNGGRIELRPGRPDRPELVLETAGIRVTREQRRHGDARRLGCAVQRVTWRDAHGEHELDLSQPVAVPLTTVTLSRDRFELALNRSVVRFADAFVVHSRYVAERILRERNAHTPLGILHHGSEERWRDGDRREARRALGLAEDWVRSCLVVSFGGVQPHKRIDKMLQSLALALRQRPDIRLILAGSMHSGDFDPIGMARQLGLADAVRFTGYLTEVQAWDWLHAGDFSVNLRGPTTGGTSGGIFQAFSMGRSVIASDAAEQRELPEGCVVRIPLGAGEVETLARELVALRDDPSRRDRLEANVREFVRKECHWSVVARQYADHLRSFPHARASRRKLIALRAGLQRSAL